MKVRLCESKWTNKVGGDLANDFYDAIEDNDQKSVKRFAKSLLNVCRDFFDEENPDDEVGLNEIDVMISGFDDADDGEDINELLDQLFDFCDEYSILIDVYGVPEDDELFLDDKSEIDVDDHNDKYSDTEDEYLGSDDDSDKNVKYSFIGDDEEE